jgi:hypothetical protein
MGISRLSLWESAGVNISILEPLIIAAYEHQAEREWHQHAAPHGELWFTSFHASQFPGTDPYACGRAAVYGLMGLPDPAPREPRLTAMFNLGSNLEHDWVRRLRAVGQLLSKSPAVGDATQTTFGDREHWLTGASDAIVLPPGWRKAHCGEIKTTSHQKVLAMLEDRSDTPFSHDKYVRQLKTYIGLAHEAPFQPTVTVCSTAWAVTSQIFASSSAPRWCPVHASIECETLTFTVDPPDDGTLIYSSREEPLTTVSYYITLDEEHMAVGRARLAQWRDHFLAGTIPPHPREEEKSKWSAVPCKYCGLKKPCKADYQAGITELAKSHHITAAREIHPQYSYDENRATVLKRWMRDA